MTLEELLAICFPGADLPTPDVRIVCEVSGDVLCHIGVFWREVTFGGQPQTVCALGAVCTDPRWRNRGLASGLIEIAHKLAVDKGITASALFAGPDVKEFYERQGYLDFSREVPDLMVSPLIGTAAGAPSINSPADPGDRW